MNLSNNFALGAEVQKGQQAATGSGMKPPHFATASKSPIC